MKFGVFDDSTVPRALMQDDREPRQRRVAVTNMREQIQIATGTTPLSRTNPTAERT